MGAEDPLFRPEYGDRYATDEEWRAVWGDQCACDQIGRALCPRHTTSRLVLGNGRPVTAEEQSECPSCGWSDYHVRETLGYRCTWCRAVFTDEETP